MMGFFKAPKKVIEDDYQSFYSVCEWVAKAKNISLVRPAHTPQVEDFFDYVREIAEVSQIRIRKITFFPGWWTTDSGPLVAFYQNQACALLPLTGGGYEVVDVNTGNRFKLSKNNAAELSDYGFFLYPSLPRCLNTLKQFLGWGISSFKQDILMVILLQSLLSLGVMMLPLVMLFLFKTTLPRYDDSLLWQISFLLLINWVAFILLYYFRSMLIIRLKYKLNALTAPGIWDKILRFPLRFFRKLTSGETAFRINALAAVQAHFIQTFLTLFFDVTILFLLFIMTIFIFPNIFWVAFFLAIFFSLLILFILRYQLCSIEHGYFYFGKYREFVLEIISAITKIRVTNSMSKVFHLWKDLLAQRSQAELEMKFYGIGLRVVKAIMITISPLILLIVLQKWELNSSPGDLVGFASAYFLLFVVLLNSFSSLGDTLRLLPLWKKSQIILTTPTETETGEINPGALSGAVELKNIGFRYHPDDLPFFNNLSLAIQPGEFIAIVGPSGSGKSTLFRILLGFEEPEQGEVFYDGINLHLLKLRAVRQQIGVVIQNSSLIPGSLYANISCNHPKMTRQEVWEIAEKVGLAAFIKNLPMQLDTLITEGLISLSGGEIQRIILARALAQKPKILMLDEATSALDNTTQAIVQNYLRQLKVTQIVAAHRLSTIVHADRIIVMDKGEIVQRGCFNELIAKPGLFSQMAKRQFS